jgi:hypothetical protein
MVLANSSTGNITLELPPAVNVTGRIYTIKKTVLQNTVLLTGGPFDAYPELMLNSTTSLPYVSLVSSSANWHILSLSGNGTPIGSSNLVCWLKLDESSGVVAQDSSGHGNNGTLINGFTFGANSVTGVIGNGLNLDGVDDYVSCGNSASLDITGDFTMSFWVKPTVDSNTQNDFAILVGKDTGTPNGYAVQVHDTGTYYGSSGNHNTTYATGPTCPQGHGIIWS